MSVHAMSWVLRHSEERLGRRLVLIALADHARDDGTGAFPSVKSIGRDARLGERQVQRCLRELEQAGAISRQGVSKYGTVVYKVVMRGDDMTGVKMPGAASATETRVEMSPDPSLKQPVSKSPPPLAPAQEPLEGTSLAAAPNEPEAVDKKPVTGRERSIARASLKAFNAEYGTDFRAASYFTSIVMRVRENPRLEVADHVALVKKSRLDPWWERGKNPQPAPNVIWGNDKIFDRLLNFDPKERSDDEHGLYDD